MSFTWRWRMARIKGTFYTRSVSSVNYYRFPPKTTIPKLLWFEKKNTTKNEGRFQCFNNRTKFMHMTWFGIHMRMTGLGYKVTWVRSGLGTKRKKFFLFFCVSKLAFNFLGSKILTSWCCSRLLQIISWKSNLLKEVIRQYWIYMYVFEEAKYSHHAAVQWWWLLGKPTILKKVFISQTLIVFFVKSLFHRNHQHR